MPNGNAANSMSSASASVGSTNLKAFAGQFRPRNDVKLTEPDIDWSYAVIARQSKENLTTSLLPFNLGKAVLEGDADGEEAGAHPPKSFHGRARIYGRAEG